MSKTVELPKSVTDELYKSAKRCTEEVVRLTNRSMYDGTKMVLVPEGIFERLESIVEMADIDAGDWRD